MAGDGDDRTLGFLKGEREKTKGSIIVGGGEGEEGTAILVVLL